MAFSFSELMFNSQPFILIYILLNVLFAVNGMYLRTSHWCRRGHSCCYGNGPAICVYLKTQDFGTRLSAFGGCAYISIVCLSRIAEPGGCLVTAE